MRFLLSIVCFVCFSSLSFSAPRKVQRVASAGFQPIADTIAIYMSGKAELVGKVKVDTVYLRSGKKMEIHFTRTLSEYPIRDCDVEWMYGVMRVLLPERFSGYSVSMYSSKTLLEELASPFFSGRSYDSSNANKGSKGVNRSSVTKSKTKPKSGSRSKVKAKSHSLRAVQSDVPWVVSSSKVNSVTKGLNGRNIALWNSHGYYYEQSLLRWEWQRPRIFRTVEDLYTSAYAIPFVVPMLENAGAYVVMPRERDAQLNEVVVDNGGVFYYEKGEGDSIWSDTGAPGFANPKTSYESGENPFAMGDARVAKVVGKQDAGRDEVSSAMWLPSFPESGEYAVYVSYQTLDSSSENAEYVVRHNGGESSFIVNQKMGGGTWVYLGTFRFRGGENGQGVILYNSTPEGRKYVPGSMVVADAVKFGGGMGNIARKPGDQSLNDSNNVPTSRQSILNDALNDGFEVSSEVSGYPRFAEGARYWLQWAGFPESVYSFHNGLDDYKDDYMSRGRWVNALCGGSKVNPDSAGYSVPIDLALALHSDAGTSLTDSIIGTLAIYTRYSYDKDVFASGGKRIISRELADIVQTQIVEDIRALYEPQWNRRGLWDRAYFECRVPQVPAVMVEMLSHQNFADMRYGLDPRFRFSVSRSIYKGVLKFLSSVNGTEYVVQPLPVKCFAATISGSDTTQLSVNLSWTPVSDPLEPTAEPRSYIVYTRVINPSLISPADYDHPEFMGGFDNGVAVSGTSCSLSINKGLIYSFKVVAVNEGGASFPSEILSVAAYDGDRALIVNGFDRVSAPASFADADSTRAGFVDMVDGGVGYGRDYHFTGKQYEFNRAVPWGDDDAPGFGASYADYERVFTIGNTFDYPIRHGLALLKAGLGFESCSRDAVCDSIVDMKKYKIADIIMGKQIVFPSALQKAISDFCEVGGNLILSGSYIAADIQGHFARNVLKYQYVTGYASVGGKVCFVQNPFGIKGGNLEFYTTPNANSYCVESPDAIVPVGKNAWTFLRYIENNTSAAVAYSGTDYKVVSIGFPIETLTSQKQIDGIMAEILGFFSTTYTRH